MPNTNDDPEQFLREGRRKLRLGRLLLAVLVVLVLGHVEYLVLRCRNGCDPRSAVLLIAYPIIMAVAALRGIWMKWD
jgi:hypothetical protein